MGLWDYGIMGLWDYGITNLGYIASFTNYNYGRDKRIVSLTEK